MKEQNFKEEVMKIMEEAPSARKALLENYDNLLNVADYCYNSYIQSGDGGMKALEETKNFTTQSLASVAYQISTLANSVLSLLDAQTNQLRHMESSINLIGQTVEMHKEKVSRREIGIFTAVRRVPRSHKILPPAQPPAGTQPRPPYSRRPINYQQLDGLGHGMKVSGKQSDRTGTIRKASTRSTRPEPVQCPVAPPVSGSSFGKPVAPPIIPTTCEAPPECDIITTLLADAPPPPPPLVNEALGDEIPNTSVLPPPPPPPDSSGQILAPPPPPPPPPFSSESLSNHSAPPLAPPLSLETVVEEASLPPPSPPPPPPPPPDDDSFPALPNDGSELPAPPPPPPSSQEVEVSSSVVFFFSNPLIQEESPPSLAPNNSLSFYEGPLWSRLPLPLHALSLPASCPIIHDPTSSPLPSPQRSSSPPLLLLLPPTSAVLTCSPRTPGSYQLCCSVSKPRLLKPDWPITAVTHLCAVLSDLEIPAMPPPPLLDSEGGFDDILPPLPPPVDYDIDAPPQYLEKVVALYSYEASKPDDLSLNEGDIIYLMHRHDDGWWEGVLNGKRGFFPENYVQLCG
ncbi:hypothetical protein L3Q82_013771 [Scortum barcoo]|uniref:Uncharacterized protein n=1 Tax=Scortum barcoo TaxID=214431 RepID=A0ACB8VY51_9TELE|nr:hypothetical protein L3Q82_013771 [Scortum barcoo]